MPSLIKANFGRIQFLNLGNFTKLKNWITTLPARRVGWTITWRARRTIAHWANRADLRAGGAACRAGGAVSRTGRASKAASNSSSLSIGLTGWFQRTHFSSLNNRCLLFNFLKFKN